MEQPKSGFAANFFSALLGPLIRRLDKPSLPRYEGSLSIPGLANKVEILWGSHGIPHVSAQNEHDLFVAQGYLHAQERLWQMDISRRFLSGRLAEVFGSFAVPWKELTGHLRGRDTVEFDYFMRLLGIRRAACSSLQSLSDDDHERLQAYSDGVNRYIEGSGTKPPWEFRLLRYEPDLWQPEDCLTIGKGLALFLSTALFTRLNMIALAVKLDRQPEKLRSLCPSYPEDGPTITRALWDSAKNIWQFVGGTFAAGDWSPAGHGSNNWVLAPGRSGSGNAILCNDPHLRMTLPSIWYLMHLKAQPQATQPDGYEAWGASIPGFPCIQVGHNRWIAWGITAALCDDVELYREKIHPLESNLYLSGHDWLTLESQDERIRIRGKRVVKRVVRSTRHGPIISDFGRAQGSGEALSLRWTAHDPSQEPHCLYGVNRARDWPEFLASLAYQTAPTLNYVYADCKGNIGYALAGKIPLRSSVPSLLPVDGWEERNEWRGYIPFSDLPRIYNPPQGVIATANHKIVDASYPYYLSCFFEPPYRIRRIKKLLTRKQTHSLDDMANIQRDLVSLHAEELIENLRADLQPLAGEADLLGKATDKLLRWDARCVEEGVEATIFHVFYRRLTRNLLLPELGDDLFSSYVEIFNQSLAPVVRILRDPNSEWFAPLPRQRLVAKSLRDATEELKEALGGDLETWRWGRIHTLTINHGLGRLRLLRPLLSIGPFASSGDGTTVNTGFYRHSDPYGQSVGASLRMITELAEPINSRWILASGQSGHVGSPHYRDQLAIWRRGEHLSLTVSDQQAKALPRLTLLPKA